MIPNMWWFVANGVWAFETRCSEAQCYYPAVILSVLRCSVLVFSWFGGVSTGVPKGLSQGMVCGQEHSSEGVLMPVRLENGSGCPGLTSLHRFQERLEGGAVVVVHTWAVCSKRNERPRDPQDCLGQPRRPLRRVVVHKWAVCSKRHERPRSPLNCLGQLGRPLQRVVVHK